MVHSDQPQLRLSLTLTVPSTRTFQGWGNLGSETPSSEHSASTVLGSRGDTWGLEWEKKAGGASPPLLFPKLLLSSLLRKLHSVRKWGCSIMKTLNPGDPTQPENLVIHRKYKGKNETFERCHRVDLPPTANSLCVFQGLSIENLPIWFLQAKS